MADLLSDQFYRWIDDHADRNLFVFVHVLNPHGPYQPTPPFDAWYNEEGPGETPVKWNFEWDGERFPHPTTEGRSLRYDGEILENDHTFGTFLDALAERGALNDSLVVLTSDHGERLGDHGLWGHNRPGYKAGIHVPLILSYPGRLPANLRLSDPVQLIDVMPTILDLLGVSTDGMLLQGDSLVPLIQGDDDTSLRSRICLSDEVVHRRRRTMTTPEGSLFYHQWHIIFSAALPGDPTVAPVRGIPWRAFNYVGDPHELSSVTPGTSDEWLTRFGGADNVIAYELLSEVQACNMRIRELLADEDEEESINLDPTVQEELRGLGYL
jgi:arylsulfatase A-like enzyme